MDIDAFYRRKGKEKGKEKKRKEKEEEQGQRHYNPMMAGKQRASKGRRSTNAGRTDTLLETADFGVPNEYKAAVSTNTINTTKSTMTPTTMSGTRVGLR